MIPPNAPKLETELKLSVLKGLLPLSSPVSAEAIAHVIDADEYDVEKVFRSEKEAREYSEKNGIKDVSF